MEKFLKHTGIAVPLRRSNVDTDQIIPAVYLKRVTRSGFEDGLFAAWRNDPEFVLNKDEYKNGTILVAGVDFGTGSSREHAVWALQNYGFKTFGDLIDETYDTIEDPVERLQAIVIELKRIANLPIVQKEILFSSMRDVADYNRRLFFSTEWHDKIIKEYQDNLNSAIQILDFKKTQPVIRF